MFFPRVIVAGSSRQYFTLQSILLIPTKTKKLRRTIPQILGSVFFLLAGAIQKLVAEVVVYSTSSKRHYARIFNYWPSTSERQQHQHLITSPDNCFEKLSVLDSFQLYVQSVCPSMWSSVCLSIGLTICPLLRFYMSFCMKQMLVFFSLMSRVDFSWYDVL